MSGKLIDTLIRENNGVVYSAKIYESNSYHYVDYYKEDDLIETRNFTDGSLDRVRAAVTSWMDGIRVLKS